jgi:hypothetical protein
VVRVLHTFASVDAAMERAFESTRRREAQITELRGLIILAWADTPHISGGGHPAPVPEAAAVFGPAALLTRFCLSNVSSI